RRRERDRMPARRGDRRSVMTDLRRCGDGWVDGPDQTLMFEHTGPSQGKPGVNRCTPSDAYAWSNACA
ncbi:MAG: hypothetical protein KGQ59_04800, partial [Bdellovibrionales bacterium]|nr:hypothetical protein [Bdellovibrionales bacterium]